MYHLNKLGHSCSIQPMMLMNEYRLIGSKNESKIQINFQLFRIVNR